MSLYARLWTDILGDPKLMRASRKGARHLVILPWLFAFAKQANDGGRLSINGEPAEPQDIADLVPSVNAAKIERGLRELEAIGVLSRDDDGVLRLANWERRSGGKPSDAPDAVRERVARHRDRQRAAAEVTPSDVTPCNAPDVTHEEEEIEIEQELPLQQRQARALADRLPTPSDKRALALLLRAVPSPGSWIAEMDAHLEGMHGPALTPAAVGTALRDFEANGGLATPKLSHFRAYLRTAGQQASREYHPPARTTRGRAGSRLSPGEQQVANVAAALGGRR